MKKRNKAILGAVILLGIVVFALVYTRPQTIEQRYPVLDLSQCTGIGGYYDNDGTGIDRTKFTITPDDPDFDEMIDRFQSTAFKTRLQNIFPPKGQSHRYSEGDFRWIVLFSFEDVLYPNGDICSGELLEVDNFFGNMKLQFDGEWVLCSVDDQEQWLRDVMDTIVQYTD